MRLSGCQFRKTGVEYNGGRSLVRSDRRGRSRVDHLERKSVEFRSSLHQDLRASHRLDVTPVILSIVPKKSQVSDTVCYSQKRHVVTRDASDFFAAQWRIGGPFSGMVCGDFRTSCADDLVGGTEDFLGALFRYSIGVRITATAEPVLYIAASIIGSLKRQRFAAK